MTKIFIFAFLDFLVVLQECIVICVVPYEEIVYNEISPSASSIPPGSQCKELRPNSPSALMNHMDKITIGASAAICGKRNGLTPEQDAMQESQHYCLYYSYGADSCADIYWNHKTSQKSSTSSVHNR